MARPRQRTPELRSRILEVAIDRLAADGVGAITARAVAEAAGTSAPAIYEFYGDKAGLVRAVFYEAFRRLLERFRALPETDDPLADLKSAAEAHRRFAVEHPHLFRVMYAEPFQEFSPGPREQALGDGTRRFFVGRLRRCTDAGLLSGDPTDLAHALLALLMGLATQETSGWLGRTRRECDARWTAAVRALLAGMASEPGGEAP